MNIYMMIQARMSSSRLPGKVLLPLCGMSVLEVIFKRLSVFQNHLSVATSEQPVDRSIAQVCHRNDIQVFQGDLNNVLSRYYYAAKSLGVNADDLIIRLTADSPFIDANIVQQGIDYFREHRFDYVLIGTNGGFPCGMSAELFNFFALEEAFYHADSDTEREHVTPYIHRRKKNKFHIGYLQNVANHSRFRLTLDEWDDYLAIFEIYDRLGCRFDFHYDELISLLSHQPDLVCINQHVQQRHSA